MAQLQFASSLIDQTISTFNGNVAAVSPQDGLSLLNNWISTLHTNAEPANPLVANLQALTGQLQNGNPDSEQIQSLLKNLAEQTRQAGRSAGVAWGVGCGCRKFGRTVGGRTRPGPNRRQRHGWPNGGRHQQPLNRIMSKAVWPEQIRAGRV